MCQSFEISIISFIIGIFVARTLYFRNKPYDKTLAILISFYSFMQLFEAMMWHSIKTDNIELNLKATKYAYIILWTHVFALGYGIYLETKETFPMLAGIIIFAYGLSKMPIFKKSQPTLTSNGHLVWGFDPSFYTLIFGFAIAIILRYTNLSYTNIALLFYILTFIFAYKTNQEAIGSYWCWIAAFFSFIPLILTQ